MTPRLSLLACLFCLAFCAQAWAQPADSLPAFKPDSANLDPIRRIEAGSAPWSAEPADSAKTGKDGLGSDSAAAGLRKRYPSVSVHVGIDFMDLDSKERFNAAVAARVGREKLKVLQPYESVHLAFPVGAQFLWPIAGYVDLVAKTHSYWYKQTAVLGDSSSNHAGDEWYALQANLGGCGLRLYAPPSLLSVSGGLGLFAQGVVYWNLGNSELYSNHGSAKARFDPGGSAFEIQLGLHKAITGPWQVTGAIGFLRQSFASNRPWSDVLIDGSNAGKAEWGSSAVQATLQLWYRFGVPAPVPTAVPIAVPTAIPKAAPVTPAAD